MANVYSEHISDFQAALPDLRHSRTPSGLFSPVFFQFAADCAAIATSYAIFTVLRYLFGAYDVPFEPSFMHLVVLPFAIAVYFLPVFWMFGLYRDWLDRSPFDEFFVVMRASFWSCFALFMLIVLDSQNFQKYRLKIIIFWIILFSAVFAFRLSARLLQRNLRRRGIVALPTVIIGSAQRINLLLDWMRENPARGYYARGLAVETGSEMPQSETAKITSAENADSLIAEIRPQVVLISSETIGHQQLLTITSHCAENKIRVKIVPDLYEIFTGLARAVPMYGAPLIEVTTQILRPWQETAKRTFDIIFSLATLIVGLPVWLLIAAIVGIETKGGVLFLQTRIGKNGKPFRMYKFRSMVQDAEKDGQKWTTVNDPRVTRFGRILRKTHLDEIPQFWNVLIGDMSIVGPRPEQPKFVDRFTKILPYYSRRLIVRPGITGWWQINSKAYSESVEQIELRLRNDFYYIENMSLKLDFEILIRTVYCVISGHGQT